MLKLLLSVPVMYRTVPVLSRKLCAERDARDHLRLMPDFPKCERDWVDRRGTGIITKRARSDARVLVPIEKRNLGGNLQKLTVQVMVNDVL
jgi:hypothetical protein